MSFSQNLQWNVSMKIQFADYCIQNEDFHDLAEVFSRFAETNGKLEILIETDDGKVVDTFPGVMLWAVMGDHRKPIELHLTRFSNTQAIKLRQDTKLFSTEHAANEYLQMNKPAFSIIDIKKMFDLTDEQIKELRNNLV